VKTFRSSTLILRTFLVALALVTAASVARAGTVTYDSSVSNQDTDLSNVASTPVVPQFNSALGTLTEVIITFQGTGNSIFTIYNSSTSPTPAHSITAHDTIEVDLNSTNGAINSILTSNSFQDFVQGGVSIPSLASGNTYTSPLINLLSVGGDTLTLSSGLAPFIGAGNLGLDVNTVTDFTNGGFGGNLHFSQASMAGGDITVTYDYNNAPPPPVPEPGSLGLFGTGLLGLAGLVRHKFMKSR